MVCVFGFEQKTAYEITTLGVQTGALPIFPLSELREQTGGRLSGYPAVHTGCGLVFTLVCRVPEAGDRVSHGGVEFIVLEADQTRVVRVRAEKTGEGA